MNPFSPRTLVAILVIGLSTFGLGLVLAAYSPDVFDQGSPGNDTYSYSLVGHRALAEFLRRSGMTVVTSRNTEQQHFNAAFPLLLLEPEAAVRPFGPEPPGPDHYLRDADHDERLERLVSSARLAGTPVVLALPKWRAVPSAIRPGWIESLQPAPEAVVERLLNDVVETARAPVAPPGPQQDSTDDSWENEDDYEEPDPPRPPGQPLRIARVDALGPPQVQELGPDASELDLGRGAQVIKPDPRLTPLLSTAEGVLVGFVQEDVYLISDPDLLNNRGLGKGDHAAVVQGLLRDHLDAEGVLIDETMHGHTSGTSLLGRVMRFPLVLIVIHVALAMALAAWSLARRFGTPSDPPPALPPGKRLLIDNTSRLLLAGGEHADGVRRYLRVTLARLGRRFSLADPVAAAKVHGPSATRTAAFDGELITRLQALSDSQNLDVDLAGLVRAVMNPKLKPSEALRLASRIHTWRLAMTGAKAETS